MYRVNVGVLALFLSTICLTSNYAKVEALAVKGSADNTAHEEGAVNKRSEEDGAPEAGTSTEVFTPEFNIIHTDGIPDEN
ncbi:hypothetical protein BB561_000925 [Smittium simulii]|uniref:Secreted protein n=1 Tax=Smittium simulii TaxID=133385 RepID=A0A2T9YWY1_9FUNG|nr:hypothetical protein BB561_000925 [Smittium simulii]